MSETTTKRQELEAKLAANRAAREVAEEEQTVKDLEAQLALEEEHGTIAVVTVARYVTGQPTRAFLKTPTPVQYRRYKDMIHRAVSRKDTTAQQEAAELLAMSCWVYPATPEARKAMLDAFPGITTPIASAAATLAEGTNEAVGKG